MRFRLKNIILIIITNVGVVIIVMKHLRHYFLFSHSRSSTVNICGLCMWYIYTLILLFASTIIANTLLCYFVISVTMLI